MHIRKPILYRKRAGLAALGPPLLAFYLVSLGISACAAAPSMSAWEAVDRRVAQTVYQINVAIDVKLKDGLYAQLADLSPRKHYPVFVSIPQHQGFRVIGHGTCFPVRALKGDRSYLLTNKHVIDFGTGMVQECQRFYAGMRIYAERSAGFSNPDQRYKDLQRIVNFATKKNMSDAERMMYRATVDTIWDMYDDHLSLKNDPQRKEFDRCVKATGLVGSIGYFVHSPGPLSAPPMAADLYRQAKKATEPDLAIIAIKRKLDGLELEPAPAAVGQQVQAVGYPEVAAPTKGKPSQYVPSFSFGKVTRVQPALVHFDAPVSKGDSGGPLINPKGKVLGVVARRAMPDVSTDRYAGAISVKAVKAFAPELFGK